MTRQFFFRLFLTLALLAIVGLAPPIANSQSIGDETLYTLAVTTGPGVDLVQLDPTSGIGTIVGPLVFNPGGAGETFFDTTNNLEFDPDGNLRAHSEPAGSNIGEIITIDFNTGEVTSRGPIPNRPDAPFGFASCPSFAIDSDGTLYGLHGAADVLFTIDPVTGAQGGSGLGLGANTGTSGMDFSPDGVLHVVTITSGNINDGIFPALYTVDKTTGLASFVGEFRVDFGRGPENMVGRTSAIDLAFNAKGTLFVSTYIDNIPLLLDVDVTTGIATVIASLTTTTPASINVQGLAVAPGSDMDLDMDFDMEFDVDFARDGNALGWISETSGGATVLGRAGEGAVAGLCVFTPAAGTNFALWSQPRDQAIDLVRNKVYRIRFAVSTDQINPSVQPLWNILATNFNPTTGKIIHGGERWFFDHVGGANGIGQKNRAGFNEFDYFYTPIAVQTSAWNGDVDNSDSPFDDSGINAADAAFSLVFRVLDVDLPSIGDGFGTVCLRGAQVDSIDRDTLTTESTLFGDAMGVPEDVDIQFATPMAMTNKSPEGIAISLDEQDSPDEGVTPGIGRAFVAFNDSAASGFPAEYPIVWNDFELLCVEAEIRASGSTSDKPVDVISMGWQAATNELGGTDFMFRGQPGDTLDQAGSPRGPAAANSTYTSYFYTHHSTDVDLADLPNANRLRAVLDFFNRTDLVPTEAGDGLLSDQLTIQSFHVTLINTDAFDPPQN